MRWIREYLFDEFFVDAGFTLHIDEDAGTAIQDLALERVPLGMRKDKGPETDTQNYPPNCYLSSYSHRLDQRACLTARRTSSVVSPKTRCEAIA